MKKLLLSLCLTTLTLTSSAKEIILSDKAVNIPLPVGKEISITFPKAVTQIESLELSRTEDLSQLLRPDGVLMLEANDPFGEARIIASMVDGNIVVLDLNAQVGAINHESIKLIDPKSLKKTAPKPTVTAAPVAQKPFEEEQSNENPYKPAFLKDGEAKTLNVAESHPTAAGNIGFKQMVQFGFRHFSGPSRLIGNLPAKEIKLSQKNVGNWVRVWRDRISVKPLKQWKVKEQYLTVLLVNNTSPFPVEFDPRALRGRMMFSAALYPVIAPQGSLQDQTLWAVITAVPFNKAIQ